jgi:hypothetical protein
LTALLRLAAGEPTQLTHFAALFSLECFVLTGELRLGNAHVSKAGYCYFSSQNLPQSLVSQQDCEVLFMLQREEQGSEEEAFVLDTTTLVWQSPLPGSAGGLFCKYLRMKSEHQTYLVKAPALWCDPSAEIHDEASEEAFVYSGEMLMGARGIARAGGYFFRPSQRRHGPLATLTGSECFFRSFGPFVLTRMEQTEEDNKVVRDYFSPEALTRYSDGTF